MHKYIIKRILLMIPVMLGVIVIIFTLMYFAPGDGARVVLGTEASDEAIEQFREEWGLNDPYYVRLTRYIANILVGDLGISQRSNTPVIEDILVRFENTARLAFLSVFFGGILGIVLGIVSAVKQYSLLDRIASMIALIGIATPSFWLALMLILLFSVYLGWLPASGVQSWKNWILPVISMSLYESGYIMRISRSAMLDVLRQDYMRTARAKGQSEYKVIMKHGFRNALIPIVTILGLQICSLLAGAVVIESVFAIPGTGKYLYDSISARDFPAVQGAIIFAALLSVLINLVMDLLYGMIDPRVRTMYQSVKKEGN